MRRVAAGVLGCALGFCAGMGSAMGAASNTIRLALNARQGAMAGTCRAFTDDGITPLCNPAGIVMQEGAVLQSNGALLLSTTRYEDPQNEPQSGGKTGAGTNGLGDFGLIHKIGNSPFGYGIGVYTYSGLRLKYDINSTLLTATGTEKSSFDVTLIQQRIVPALAMKVTDNLAFGGGFVFAYQTYAQAQPLQMSTQAEPAALAGLHGYIDADTDGWGEGGVFGAMWKLDEKTRLGAAYTTKMTVKAKGKAELTFRNNPTLIPFGIQDKARAGYDVSTSFKWPQVLSLGIAHQPREDLLLAFDWQWFDWSRAGDSLPLILTNGDNAAVNAVVIANGSNGGQMRDPLKVDLRDVFTYQFGGEWKPKSNLALRAGYVFATNPIKNLTIQPLLDVNIQHTMSFGAGTDVRGWGVDVAWSHSFFHNQGAEYSDVEGGEFTGSKTGTGADFLFLSLTKRF